MRCACAGAVLGACGRAVCFGSDRTLHNTCSPTPPTHEPACWPLTPFTERHAWRVIRQRCAIKTGSCCPDGTGVGGEWEAKNAVPCESAGPGRQCSLGAATSNITTSNSENYKKLYGIRRKTTKRDHCPPPFARSIASRPHAESGSMQSGPSSGSPVGREDAPRAPYPPAWAEGAPAVARRRLRPLPAAALAQHHRLCHCCLTKRRRRSRPCC